MDIIINTAVIRMVWALMPENWVKSVCAVLTSPGKHSLLRSRELSTCMQHAVFQVKLSTTVCRKLGCLWIRAIRRKILCTGSLVYAEGLGRRCLCSCFLISVIVREVCEAENSLESKYTWLLSVSPNTMFCRQGQLPMTDIVLNSSGKPLKNRCESVHIICHVSTP